ncbi:MAG: tRNA (adenine-N1)-methyltransferase [Candidatus Bathyarchaeota archaeon]|nr:MAG: tRNA (adenine-N1)-methyltransferase [Candidatus Bathyarchaeota archaeon]
MSAIEEGQDVLLYLDSKRTYLVRIVRDKDFHTHKGFLSMNEILGRKIGDSIKSSTGVRFFLLRPEVRDYALKSSRRTQVMYQKDMAQILLLSGICSGYRVVEAGTGSASLTMILAYYVKPAGKVYSYDIRREMLETARNNLSRSGLLPYVELREKDVAEGIDEENVDAVILDLATPWLVVSHAKDVLKPSSSFVSFSPNIEQVVKTVEELEKHQFVDIRTTENIIRRYRVKRNMTRPESLMIGHTGYLVSARKTGESTA